MDVAAAQRTELARCSGHGGQLITWKRGQGLLSLKHCTKNEGHHLQRLVSIASVLETSSFVKKPCHQSTGAKHNRLRRIIQIGEPRDGPLGQAIHAFQSLTKVILSFILPTHPGVHAKAVMPEPLLEPT